MTYQQATGRWLNDMDEVVGIGYAGGDQGRHPEGKNNPALESEKDIGPLPAGNYHADYMVLWHPRLGHYVIHLKPDEKTRAKIIAYGRDPDSFFNHGDNPAHPGESSDGCPVNSLDVRQAFWQGTDHDIQVVSGLGEL
jgi:hypothetical protein